MIKRQYKRDRMVTCFTTRANYWAIRELAAKFHMSDSEMTHWLLLAMVARLDANRDTKYLSEVIAELFSPDQSDLFYNSVENAASKVLPDDVPW